MSLPALARMHGMALLILLAPFAAGAAGEAAPSRAVPAAAAGALPTTLPLRRDPVASSGPSSLVPAFGLLAVGGLAGGLWLWRRRGVPAARRRGIAGGGHAVLRLSSQALTPHASVHAVQWQGEEFLLACTAQNVRLLARRPAHNGEAADS